jgi:hypothetical protein
MSGGTYPDQPVAGFYRFRFRSGAHPVGVRIWHGPPLDPMTGEEMDRSWRWQATANRRPVDLDRVWPRCAKEPIDEREHDYLAGVQDWAERHAPDSAQADPRRKINLLTSLLPF